MNSTCSTTCHKSPQTNDKWIKLKDKKSFSRVLYTNPVCFLTTVRMSDNITASPVKNVMVVSWLTPVNNNGRFMMSINKRRHTSTVLTSDPHSVSFPSLHEFVLCVPVAGMEELVLNVGKTSGRWGRSKFPQDYSAHRNVENPDKKRIHFSHGIDGLFAVKVGTSDQFTSISDDGLQPRSPFAIKGTVAHLKCAIHHIASEHEKFVDNEHNLIIADVIEAYVHCDYWDGTKNQFFPQQRGGSDNETTRPSSSSLPPPYLTFFGSQKFGYVATTP